MIYSNVKKRIEYKYDSENNLIEELTFVNGEIDSKTKYHYKKFST